MINKKIIVLSVSVLCVMQSYGMERQEEQTIATAYNNGWMTGPDAIYQYARAGVNLVASSANSLWETTTIAASDVKKLSKLGYPPNEVNDTALARFIAIKARHEVAIAANDYKNETFVEDAAFIERRQNFVNRAVNLMPDRPDGIELALFCLNNYQSVMNAFIFKRACAFIASKQELVQGQAISLENQLNDLAASNNNQILRLVKSALNASASHAQENSGLQVEQQDQDAAELYEVFVDVAKAIEQDKRKEEAQ